MMKRGFAGVVETSTSLKSQPAPLSGKRLVTASSIQRRSIIYLFLAGFQEGGGHEIKPCEQQVEYVFASV